MNGKELIILADLVAKDKNLDRDSVLRSLEEGIATAIKKNYPEGAEIVVEIDPRSNSINAWQHFALVDKVDDFETQITLKNAKVEQKEHDVIDEEGFYQHIEFKLSRQQFNITKQVALQKLKTEIKETMLEKLDNSNEQFLSGTVKMIKKDSFIVETASLEIVLPKKELMPRDRFKINDRIYFIIDKIVRSSHSTVVYASRRSDKFLEEVLKREISLIDEGVIEIKKISRMPGYNTKVALTSRDDSVDPIRVCVGPRGQHIKNINQFMHGENIDFVKWSDDSAQFFINCMQPVQPVKISIDEDSQSVDVVVSEGDADYVARESYIQHLLNLTGWKARFYSEEKWDEKEESSANRTIKMFVKNLDVDEEIAVILANMGFVNLEAIAYTPSQEFEVDELDADTIEEIKTRAKDFLDSLASNEVERGRYELFNLGLSLEDIDVLVNNKISNKEIMADLDRYELQEFLTHLDDDTAQKVIMNARQ